MAVEHEEDGSLTVTHKSFELGDEQRSIELAGIHVVPKGTVGIDRGNGVHLLALTTGRDDGRLTSSTPGALQGRVRSYIRFIDEEDVGTEPLGPCLQLGIVLLFPLGDRYWVALIGAGAAFSVLCVGKIMDYLVDHAREIARAALKGTP